MSVPGDDRATEPDDDHYFLDQVLNKLYDFGDGAGKRKSKRKSSSATEDHHENDTQDNPRTSHNTYLELHVKNASNSTVCENTASETQRSTVEVVTFIDPRKKHKGPKIVEPVQKVSDVKESEKTDLESKLAIEKARLEVHQFGLSGYKKGQQRVFEQDRAIMLGARPPKKQHVNYKVYQQMIKEKKLKEKEEAKSEFQKQKGKGGRRGPERSKSSSGGQLGGQVGRFKNGVLALSSNDIEKVNFKRKK
ncbi:uncharacterized protein C1orf131 homolog [Triplophysa dalaica]|uniref:uncharacterized protein C1orf131 homolog n=1 Tax=Triplophysa dalaica TaxID=1582913 RepID=UPI0024E002F1|nr:uncharacterized protein C1orf131 homolog [Triplophysa dalaica]